MTPPSLYRVVKRTQPHLRIDISGLGTVDPFRLRMIEDPPESGDYQLEDPSQQGRRATLEIAGLSLAGAGQALLLQSMRWMDRAERRSDRIPLPPVGAVRMVLKRREARLLAALLRRHVARLGQPPAWMPQLVDSLVQIDEFLRWEDCPFGEAR